MSITVDRTGHPLRGLFVLLALTSCSVALAALPFDLPPISNPASTEHHPGKVIWADLVTPNLVAAESFYGGLFGWTFQAIEGGDTDYAVALLDGRPIAGMLQKAIPAGEKRRPAWLTFIAVRDVDAARRIAITHGARILSEPKTYGGRGRQSVIADPEGAVFAVLASASGDPPDFLAAPGDWIWSASFERDPKRSAAFYSAVFGFNVFDLPNHDGAEHLILSSDDYARAAIHTLPPSQHHSHWLNFVRVVDAVETSAKAVELGGRVVVEPFVDRHGGKIAVIVDPTGAAVGVMEWSDSDTKVEPK